MAEGMACPGQDRRFWKPEDLCEIACPNCGVKMELWKDDPYRDCKACGTRVKNPKMDMGCAQWCKFAADCLGTEVPGPEPGVETEEKDGKPLAGGSPSP